MWSGGGLNVVPGNLEILMCEIDTGGLQCSTVCGQRLWMCEQRRVPRVWSGGLDKDSGYVRGWVAQSVVRGSQGCRVCV